MELNELLALINKIYPNQINLKSFNFKHLLNQKIWKHNKLKDNIRKRLLKIAKDFIKFTDLEIIPVDIVIVGSIASFNWSKYSDIDLHIITDFKAINDNTELVKNYLYSKKWEWNTDHKDLKMYGYDVELYALDVNEENASNGIYSVKYNHWIKIPSAKHKQLDKDTIKETAAMYINKVEYYNRKFNELTSDKAFLLLQQKVDYLYDLIIQGRKKSLPVEGEQAAGNIIFKVLRRSGHLEMINELKKKLFDKINSIEETYKVEDDKLITESLSLNEYGYEDGRNTPEFVWKFPNLIWGDIKLGYSAADRADWWMQFDGIRETEHDKKTLTVYGTEDGVYEALDNIFQYADEDEVQFYFEQLDLPGWEEDYQSIDLIETCIDYYKVKE